ncbi:MAG: hypothetical protein IJZ59_06050 [Alphaproteobacteria bacterium]|nr:hypothetical protein [Alphaproteobacteria bacterium]
MKKYILTITLLITLFCTTNSYAKDSIFPELNKMLSSVFEIKTKDIIQLKASNLTSIINFIDNIAENITKGTIYGYITVLTKTNKTYTQEIYCLSRLNYIDTRNKIIEQPEYSDKTFITSVLFYSLAECTDVSEYSFNDFEIIMNEYFSNYKLTLDR